MKTDSKSTALIRAKQFIHSMSHIQYQPVANKVLVQFTKPDRGVILPEDVGDPTPDIRVLAIGPNVTVCKPNDKIITRPDVNILCLEIKDEGKVSLCLIDASAIIAIDLGPEISLAG